MKLSNHVIGVLGGAVALGCASQSQASVSLLFTNNTSTPASVTVAPGRSFTVSVDITATSAGDQFSANDYDITSSFTGSLASEIGIEFISRNISNGQFTSANGFTDAQLQTNAMGGSLNAVLSPSLRYNGSLTDLGSSLNSGYLSGPVTGTSAFDQADYVFEVLPNTAPGQYILSFNDNPDVEGPPPNYADIPVNSASTFTVNVAVPEPATCSLLLLSFSGLALRRRGH